MDIPARRCVLDNGLTVVCHEDHSAPIVSVYVYYHVGSSREQEGKTGFAHLFEHMLFQGSEHVQDNGHFQLIQEAGGTLNGTTNQDRTNYYETLPKEHLELALFLESDRMGHLLSAMTQAKLDNQRDVVMNERRQSYENRPYGLVYETILAALYPEDHPYSWPTIGSMADIKAATLDDVDAFFRRWYGPNNATLVIAGDVACPQAFELAHKWFGALLRGADVSTPAARPACLLEGRRLILEDRVQLPQLNLTWPTVEAWHPDEPALNLLADVLSANGSSVLDRALMIEEELASAVTISHGTSERAGALTITLRPAKGATLTQLEARTDQLIEQVLERGVQEARLERLKNRLEGGVLRGLESVSARAAMLGHDQCFRGEVDLLERSLERHRAVSAEDLLDVARRYIVKLPRVVLSTVPVGALDQIAEEQPVCKVAVSKKQDRSHVPPAAQAEDLVLPQVERWDAGRAQEAPLAFGIMERALPLVHLSVTLPGGRTLEKSEESGRVGLLAALLQEATARYASADMPDVLDGLGSTLQTFGGAESVVLRMTTLERTLEESLALAREVLEQPRFAADDVERLGRQLLLAIQTRADRPGELADDLFNALVFGPDDARGRFARGSAEALKGFDRTAVQDLWGRLTSAAVPSLSVVGCADIETVYRGLGFDERRSEQTRIAWDRSSAKLVHSPGIYLVDKPSAKLSELRVGHLGIARNDPDFDALMAANHALGGSFSSRINMNLREDKGWTYGARSSLSGGQLRGYFRIATAVETGVTGPALGQIFEELDRVKEGFQKEEADFCAVSLSRSLRRAYAGTASRLAYLDNLAKYGFGTDYPNRRLEFLAGLKAADLDAAAERHLHSENLVAVVVGDALSIRAGLEALDRGPVLDGNALAGLQEMPSH